MESIFNNKKGDNMYVNKPTANNPTGSKTIAGLDQDVLLAVVKNHCDHADVECFKWYWDVKEVCECFNIDSDTLSDKEWKVVEELIADNLPTGFFNQTW